MDGDYENEEYLDNDIDSPEDYGGCFERDEQTVDANDSGEPRSRDEQIDEQPAGFEQTFGCPLSPLSVEEGDGQEQNLEQLVPDDAEDNYVFFFKGIFSRRLFRTQLRPKEYCTRNVGGNTPKEVFDSIWFVAVKQIERQVIFDGEKARWSDRDKPGIDDIDHYVTLQDPSKKKTYSVSAVTPRVLRTWRGKIIKIHVYVYSTNVETNAQYRIVLRTLIAPQNPDRAGADSTKNDAELADHLRKIHPELEGHHSSWLLWANFVHSSSAHDRERLKEAKAPPLELAKYFRWTSVSEAARLQSVHRGMSVAQTVNSGWAREVTELKTDIDLAVSILLRVSQKIDAMMAKATYGSELFEVLESVTQPEETELSHQLAAKVTDCADIDHA
ncbi:uncharacterized protein LOC110679385 [Aedes aegypti]|uniref:Uncharacterized protein n=1 Tax=Aedes aegypti TaxID=7159 RepID=A0A6I8U175_AEDAE|nr:uncharacterized protein LOC110679385 [Aedes aegypti]